MTYGKRSSRETVFVLSRGIISVRYPTRIVVFLLLHEILHIFAVMATFYNLCIHGAWVTYCFPYVTCDIFYHCFRYTSFNCDVTDHVINGRIQSPACSIRRYFIKMIDDLLTSSINTSVFQTKQRQFTMFETRQQSSNNIYK